MRFFGKQLVQRSENGRYKGWNHVLYCHFGRVDVPCKCLDKNGDGKVTSKEWGAKVFQNKEIMSKHFGSEG